MDVLTDYELIISRAGQAYSELKEFLEHPEYRNLEEGKYAESDPQKNLWEIKQRTLKLMRQLELIKK